MARRVGPWALGIAVGILAALSHGRISVEPKALRGGEAWVPQPEVAEILAIGFEGVVADLQWLRAVQIAGAGDEDPTQHAPVLGRLIDVTTTLDPWVDHPYRFAAIWMTDSEQSVRSANRLLERGIAHHPDDWRMRFYKGFNHFFYLRENEAAADELEHASRLPGAPLYLPRLVARLRSEVADLEAAAVFLHELVKGAEDEAARAQYQAALEEVQMERVARVLDEARERYRALHGRDIERVEDLLAGEPPVLRALPPAEPPSLPADLRRGSRWELDPESGRIQSSYYGRRYELNVHPLDRERQARWAARRRAEGAQGGQPSHVD